MNQSEAGFSPRLNEQWSNDGCDASGSLVRPRPRQFFSAAIGQGDVRGCMERAVEIHGHYCPGIALGTMASVYGLRQPELAGEVSEGMEDLMAIVETNACFADGVQVVSGCTLGNNALVYRDFGRTAATFTIRGLGVGIRVAARPNFQEIINQSVPDFFPLLEIVIMRRAGTADQEAEFKFRGREAAYSLVGRDFDELFTLTRVDPILPDYAPIVHSSICPVCGESVMGTKMVMEGEKKGMCRSCAAEAYWQVEGQGIVSKCGRCMQSRPWFAPWASVRNDGPE